MAILPEISEAFCEPFADSSQIPTLLAAGSARRHVSHMLTGDGGDGGDGGDELFFGHAACARALRNARLTSMIPDTLRRLLRRRGLYTKESARLGGWRAALGETISRSVEESYLLRVSHWRNPHCAVLGSMEYPTIYDTPMDQLTVGSPGERVLSMDIAMELGEGLMTKTAKAGIPRCRGPGFGDCEGPMQTARTASVSDARGMFVLIATNQGACQVVGSCTPRGGIAAELIEQGQQRACFVLQQRQCAFTGLFHCTCSRNARRRPDQTGANRVPAVRPCRSGVLALLLRLGVHGFQRDHAGNAGGCHGATMVGKGRRQRSGCQVRAAADADLRDIPAGHPAMGGGIAFGGMTGELVIA